jgi:L-cysteine S-thiosulfotransferase
MMIDSLRRITVLALLPLTLLMQESLAGAPVSRVDAGRRLAHDFDKGNCLACHAAPSDPQAITRANIAPPLTAMRERFSDRAVLRSQIWDASQRNPETIMPPFGRHLILSDDEIELIIDYLYTL